MALSSVLAKVAIFALAYSSFTSCQFEESSSEEELVHYVTRHPYIVNVRGFGMSSCSGVIIGDHTVLTAAQCVDPREGLQLKPILWLNATRTQAPTADVLIREAVETIFHPNYTGNAQDGYDMALMKLNESAIPLRAIRVLPEDLDHPVVPGERTFSVLGFGRTSLSGARTTALQIGQVQVLDPQLCTEADIGYLEGQMFCVDASLPCSGDEGGPVFLDRGDPETDVLYGLISGTRCFENIEMAGVTTAATAETISWLREVREQFEETGIDNEELLGIGESSKTPSGEPDVEDMLDMLLDV